MSDQSLAETSVKALATMMHVDVDPVLLARLSGLLVSALMGDPFSDAIAAGNERAAKVRTVLDAEKAAAERK